MHEDVKPKLISGFGKSAPEWGSFRRESSAVGGPVGHVGLVVVLPGCVFLWLLPCAVVSICVEQISETVSFLILKT